MKARRSRNFMYMQDLDHLPFDVASLENRLEKSGAEEWAYILHDKDTDKNGEKIRPHYHIVLRFKDAKTCQRVAKFFDDKSQYVEIWSSSINNAYSYLLHETSNAQEKYRYDAKEVTASFDFLAKIKSIRKKAKRPSKQFIQDSIENYSNELISKDELQSKIGVLEIAKRKKLIDNIEEILALKKHQRFLSEYKGQQCYVFFLYGEAGVGKTRLVRNVLQKCHPGEYSILGSQRDHFQEYKGQYYIVINDIRPGDYEYGQLLTLLDPWEIDKMAPARYHDKYLNAKSIYITTPYSPLQFYRNCKIENREIDTFKQLERRVIPVCVTANNIEKLKKILIKFNSSDNSEKDKSVLIEKIKSLS